MFYPYKTLSLFIALLFVWNAGAASAISFDSPIGKWLDKYQGTEGAWYWSDTTFIDSTTATYTNPDGTIYFYATNKQIWEGYWIEEGEDACSQVKYGSKLWGVIVFQFNDDFNRYKGTWDLCGMGKKYPFYGFRNQEQKSD